MDWHHLPREILRFLKQLPDVAAVRYAPIRAARPHTLPGRLVVSLTSHPPRFLTLGLTLRSLLQQDVKPDALVLWLAPAEVRRLPRRVRRLQKDGLTIAVCKDLKSYKKIIPALTAYPEAFIVTADDDINYPKSWLRRFVEEYRNRNEILCQRARRLTVKDGRLAPYDSWPMLEPESNSSESAVFPTGLGGVLYPPGALRQDAGNVHDFMRLCPKADDLWLYWAARSGCTHRLIKPAGPFHMWGMSQLASLYKDNRKGGNDRQLAALAAAYGMPSVTSNRIAARGTAA